MVKKQGRPEARNVPYFPHYTETSNELMFLEQKYGAEGYRAFYRLHEMVAKAEDHYISLSTDTQYLTFQYSMKVDEEILNGAIDYLVEIEFIDPDLFYDKRIIWVESLVEKFRGVYFKRGKTLPTKKNGKIVSGIRKVQKRKEEKSTQKKTKEKGSSKPLEGFDVSNLEKEYQDIDFEKSFNKYLSYHGKNPNEETLRNWLESDRTSGRNKKEEDWKVNENGTVSVYCSKCGRKDIVGDIRGTKGYSSCCKVEYQNMP